MATAAPPVKRVYLYRLLTLTIDQGNIVARTIFDEAIGNIPLQQFLAHEQSSIKRLRANNVITKVQYDTLFPQSGNPPTTADFDLTLAVCLLRNLKACNLNPNFKWNALPQPTDTTLEADIRRLQMFRNELAHISTTNGMTQTLFNQKWMETEQVLNRLNSKLRLPIPNLQQDIRDCNTKALDPDTQEHLEKHIDNMQSSLEILENKVQGLQEEVTTGFSDMSKRIDEFKEQKKSEENKVDDVQADLKQTKDELKTAKGHLADVQETIGRVQGEADKHRKDVQTNMQSFKEDVHEIKYTTDSMQRKIDQLEQENKTSETGETAAEKRKFQREEEYQEKKNQLREDLAELHRDRHSTIPLSPLFEEKDTSLLDLYVIPGMNVIHRKDNKKTAIESLSEMFMSGDKYSKEIYVTADAGFGKTAFSKFLTVLWCQALFPDEIHAEYLKEENVNVMREFEFIFLVLLRETSDVCSIDDLVFNHVVQNLSHSKSYNEHFLQEILHRERCLVVLDGLDEWTHPSKCTKESKSIPHRNSHKNCTILTTTRLWKLSTTQLNTKQLDKKIELTNLDRKSALELTTRALKKLKGRTDLEMRHEAEELLKTYHDFEQVSVPLLLMYVICLWCDDIQVGQTKCGLYTSIIELLLSRTIIKYERFSQFELPQCNSDIPQCFNEQEQCKAYFTFLTSLGELAFQTLFIKTKENRLVFDSSFAENCLKEDFLELGRHTGIITQDKQTKLTSQKRKTSFSHKTVQEFFAALYISTCSDQDKVLTEVLSFCYSIQDILDLSKIFIFISGINAELFSLLSYKLMEIINEGHITSQCISTTIDDEDDLWQESLREIQDMIVSSITEIPVNKQVNICLQDFFFDEKCHQNNYFTSLQQLAVNNKTNIQSIYIEELGGPGVSGIIDMCELSDPEIHCQKIMCSGKSNEEEILRLLSTSVTYLCIKNIQRDHESKYARSCLTDEQCKTFHNSSQLETIHIHDSWVSHRFLIYIINVKSVKEIILSRLSCSEHGDLCSGFIFNLSQPTNLRELLLGGANFTLWDMNEDEGLLSHNMRNIERVKLEKVKMSSLLLRRLVEIMKQLEHSVRVNLDKCNITPREEFINIREDICRSGSFVVEKDDRDVLYLSEVFEFVTNN